MRYLTRIELIMINQRVINGAGEGTIGIADDNGLDAIVAQPQTAFFGREAYPTIWLKAAFLLQKITKKHVFFDGNKRTAYLSTFLFLKLNGFQLTLPKELAKDLVMEATLSKDTEDEMLKIAAFIEKNSQSLT